jgi:hypothetical protein
MVARAGLKAGLIGAAVLLAMTLVGRLVPMSRAVTWAISGITLVVYGGMGVMAGRFLAPPRTPGRGAGAGAISGLIGGIIASSVGVVILAFQIRGGAAVAGLSPEQLEQMKQMSESGVPILLFLIPSTLCVASIGAGVAAIGGAVYAAIRVD